MREVFQVKPSSRQMYLKQKIVNFEIILKIEGSGNHDVYMSLIWSLLKLKISVKFIFKFFCFCIKISLYSDKYFFCCYALLFVLYY